jgi:hypothetical protein
MSRIQDLFTKDEPERYRMLSEFYKNDENINMKTDLNDEEINALAVIDFIQFFCKENWNIDLQLTNLSSAIKTLKVSRNRLGRQEAITVLKGQEEKPEEKGILKRFLGM